MNTLNTPQRRPCRILKSQNEDLKLKIRDNELEVVNKTECAKLRGLPGSEKLRGSWAVGRGSWVTLRGSWVNLRGSRVLFTDNFA